MIDYISTIKAIRPIYSNIDEDRISPYIDEVLNLFVRKAINYKDIEEHPENYTTILDGGYVGDEYIAGLKKAVAYLTYSRLIQNNQISVTTYGVDYLKSEYSDQVEKAELTYQRNQSKEIGEKYLSEVIKVLNPCKKAKYSKIKVL